MPCFFCFGILEFPYNHNVVIQQVHIKIAVLVKVKEGSMGGVTRIIESCLLTFFSKCQVAVVDEQFVSSFFRIAFAGIANINIEITVAVNVSHRDSGLPSAFTIYTGRYCNFFEFKIAKIQIKGVGLHIAREIDIVQSIIVNVTD